MSGEYSIRESLVEMENVSRRSFFSGLVKGAGVAVAYDRFGPQLFAQSDPRLPYRIYSALGNVIIPVDDDPGWKTFEPGHDDTVYLGLGMRARIRETVSLVAEVSPRLYGYRPDRATWNVGIEKLTRGHVLQLNFGNSFDTTPGMIARGGSPHDVYMGFNLSRKF